MSELRIKNRSEHRTGIAEVMGSIPVGASEFFPLRFLCNCLSYYINAKITFTSIIVWGDHMISSACWPVLLKLRL